LAAMSTCAVFLRFDMEWSRCAARVLAVAILAASLAAALVATLAAMSPSRTFLVSDLTEALEVSVPGAAFLMTIADVRPVPGSNLGQMSDLCAREAQCTQFLYLERAGM
jgi:hypothetical protein